MREDSIVMSQQKAILVNQRVINEYSLYLDGDIMNLNDYIDHFSVFKNATEEDVILLYLNSNGGSVSIGQVYIKHMQECQAPIIGFVGTDCASQCAAIAMECDDLVFDELSTMLIHSFSYGDHSTANDVLRKAEFNSKLNKIWLDAHFREILTETEFSEVLAGQDVLLDSTTLSGRWEEIMQARHGAQEDEAVNDPSQPVLH